MHVPKTVKVIGIACVLMTAAGMSEMSVKTIETGTVSTAEVGGQAIGVAPAIPGAVQRGIGLGKAAIADQPSPAPSGVAKP